VDLVRGDSGGGGVVEEPIAGGLPTAVHALHYTRGLAIDGDGANHLDGPGIDDALHLDNFMTGSAYQDVEEGLDYVRGGGSGVCPLAEGAGAVAGEVVTAQGDAGADGASRGRIEAGTEDVGNVGAEDHFSVRETGGRVVRLSAEIGSPGQNGVGLIWVGSGETELPCAGVGNAGGR
jgi:hypothetical protein